MINDKELNIASISYTNKDFGVIYTEILDLARKLSDLWKPQYSNESDPGVVLLKFLAFMGDKLNYNIDKNILEAFMPSATQVTSMRKLTEMLGYYMNYYNSATTTVAFTFKGTELNKASSQDLTKQFTLDKYQTVVANDDSSLQYVLWEDVILTSDKKTDVGTVIEGYLNTFSVGDSTRITLDNLDSQNRLYFNETQVAQNGILIRSYIEGKSDVEADKNADFWELVDNLTIQNPTKKCFKFGYDSKQKLPYVEFPENIAAMIGDGLYLRYIVSSGYYGNAGVGNLNKLVTPTSVALADTEETISLVNDSGTSKMLIKNNSAAIDGANPEDIDNAYINFKKTVGTFDTLVTCRDYANFIYSKMLDENSKHIVSNCMTSDRRTDITLANNVITYDENGQHTINTAEDYDVLKIYALRPINNPVNDSEYVDSFRLMNDITPITDRLEYVYDNNHLSYNYQKPADGDIALIKLLDNLDVKVTTTYKVNVAEQADIRTNIVKALRKRFYSRNVDFGYKIPYDEIYNCIQNADNRIKTIAVLEEKFTTNICDVNNDILPFINTLELTDSAYLKLLAKNILAGKVPMFEYDKRFGYEIGMKEYYYHDEGSGDDVLVGPVLNSLSKFTSEAAISIPATEESADANPLKTNQIVQLIGPELVDDKEFGSYINYDYNITTVPEANQDYTLKEGEWLLFVYTDSASKQVEILYEEGVTVRSTFNLDQGTYTDKKTKTLYDEKIIQKVHGNTKQMWGIPTGGSICKRSEVKHTFKSSVKIAWKVSDKKDTNNLTDKLIGLDTPESGQTGHKVWEYILGENDEFIYSLDGESSYEIFGSGTSIIIKSETPITQAEIASNYFGATVCDVPNLTDLYEYGVESLSSVLIDSQFTDGVNLTLQVNNILTLAKGDSFFITGLESGSLSQLSNSWQDIGNATFNYKFFEETSYEPLPKYDLASGNKWRIRSRLDLVTSPTKIQKLEANESVTFEYITSFDDEGNPEGYDTVTLSTGVEFKTNITLDIAGGENISLHLDDPMNLVSEDKTFNYGYPYSILVFTEDPDHPMSSLNRLSGYIIRDINGSADDNTGLANFSYDILKPQNITGNNTYALVMMYADFNQDAGDSESILVNSSESGDIKLIDFDTTAEVDEISSSANKKLYILQVPASCNKITLSTSSQSSIGSLIIGTLDYVKSLNTRFDFEYLVEPGVTVANLENALTTIVRTLNTDHNFYYNLKPENSEAIETETLTSPDAFFDPNNLANRFTIQYIDLSSEAALNAIDIVRSSKL